MPGHIRELIEATADLQLAAQADRLTRAYAELSAAYQRTKGSGAEIPLP